MNIKIRLILMNFLQFAVWGAYLTSMGAYLITIGQGEHIGSYYAIQGIVSMFMPAVLGIVADRYIPAQRLLGLSHLLAAAFMIAAGFYGLQAGASAQFGILFSLYSLSVAFYMPTIGLSNSVAFTALEAANMDTVKSFPPIRIFGTIGFIISMWLVDLLGFQSSSFQFFVCGVWGIVMAIYSQTLPECPISKSTDGRKSFIDQLGLKSFMLFRQKRMAIFFIFSMLLGVSLQITNGFANPYLQSFSKIPEFQNTFGVQHSNILISLSQVSETCCILLIPYFMSRFGIKRVMLIAMIAWALRFGLFGIGDPGQGVWMFILSMIVYGVAFDFFNVSGSLYVDRETDMSIRSSAQGLFMIMTNGIGATLGTLGAQAVVNNYVDFNSLQPQTEGWRISWLIFAAYAAIVAIAFAFIFKYKHEQPTQQNI